MPDDVEYIIKLKDANFSDGIDKANSKVNGMEGSLTKMAGLVAGAFAVGKIVDFTKGLVQLAMDAEQAQVSMEVLLGDVGAAKTMISDLKKMGAATPFEFTDLQSATKTLLSFNVSAKDVLPTLSKLGDISGGNAEKLQSLSRAFGKVASGGKLTGEVVNMMIDSSFNPLSVLAKEMSEKDGISMEAAMAKMQKNVSLGKVSIHDLDHAITVATASGGQFFEMMKKQSETTAGKLSTLEDNIAVIKTEIGQSLLPAINGIMGAVSGAIEWGQANRDGLAKVFQPVLHYLNPIINAVKKLVDQFSGANSEASMLESVFNGIGAALEFMDPYLTAMGELTGEIISGLATVGAGIMDFIDRFNKPIAGLATAFRNTFVTIGQTAKDLLGGVANLVGGILSFDVKQIKEGMGQLGSALASGNPINLAYQAGKGAVEGYQKGLNTGDFFSNKKGEETSGLSGVARNPAMQGNAAAASSGGATSASSAGKVHSTKPTTININIENLVRDLKIITENLGISKDRIASEISKVLIGAVVDSQRVAGI